ncbi:suppressor APC domain-containing protein 2 isoform X2 [Mustela putorius furo]|uniref:Suppressor APC domain-containing protein 2 isoform X2 n=1 Tax=Mustela putorius furo TaxID=9669 RepID=A0A8U0S962_MUSPF|nr:suppressor APC domain-containing protein 2 isoform X2 [Mustela putorius furo]
MAGAAMAEAGRGPPAAPGTEGLPRAFLQSLRTLFDILDDRRRGCVHLREIESRWQGADAHELPRDVLEGLRRVAPASGYLTFERFVAGLRTSLLSADGGPRGQARAPAGGGCPTRPGGPPPPPRLMFAPADEPRTVLERKPLPLGSRPPAAGPGGAARSLEKLCGPAEPERPQGAALERSPSADAGALACRPRELGLGDALRVPRARGERRRHTITNGVDCDLLKQMQELEQEKEVLLQGLEMMARGRDWTWALRGAPSRWASCCPRYRRWPGVWGSCWLRPVPAGLRPHCPQGPRARPPPHLQPRAGSSRPCSC